MGICTPLDNSTRAVDGKQARVPDRAPLTSDEDVLVDGSGFGFCEFIPVI